VSRGREGTVFIGEDFDAEQFGLLTGTFTAHWQAADGQEHLLGPRGVSADEAIAWGRQHADVVLIRLGDSDLHHSAGSRHLPDLPVWPEGKEVAPRRLPGMEHLDLESPRPIPWEVRIPRRVSKRRADAELEELRAALADDPAVSDLSGSLEDGKSPRAVFEFVVQARSHPEAIQAVLDVEHRALDRFPYPDPRPWWRRLARREGWAYIETGFDPVADIRPKLG
jgi:hypothetical protein